MKDWATVFCFLLSLFFVAVCALMVGAIHVTLYGFHRECGVWSAVPFACDPSKPKTEQVVPPPAEPTPQVSPPKPEKVKSGKTPKESVKVGPTGQNAKTKEPARRVEPDRSRPSYAKEPYRVQCDPETGHCYHDVGLRGNAGLW